MNERSLVFGIQLRANIYANNSVANCFSHVLLDWYPRKEFRNVITTHIALVLCK